MKINKNKVIINVIVAIMMIAILGNYSYATNSTEKETNIIKQENVKQESKKETKITKSSEARLEDFGIIPHDFKGFKSDKKDYTAIVPEDVSKIEIYAKLKDENAKVTGTGFKNLEMGENKFTITVIAENGNENNYNLTIVRGKETEKTETKVKEKVEKPNTDLGDGLETLTIEDVEISPKFNTKKYEYTAKYTGDKQELKVEAKATDPYYEVEITGNKELKDGENIITILVSDPDGKNVATYQVILDKEKAEAVDSVAEVKERENQKKMMIAGGIIIVAMVIIIIIVIAKKRDRELTQEYSIPFSGLNSEDDDENNYWDENTENKDNEIFQENKEDLRQEFLDNYNNENDDYVEEKPRRKGKHKGKRFK